MRALLLHARRGRLLHEQPWADPDDSFEVVLRPKSALLDTMELVNREWLETLPHHSPAATAEVAVGTTSVSNNESSTATPAF